MLLRNFGPAENPGVTRYDTDVQNERGSPT